MRDLFCLLEASEKPSQPALAQSLAFARGYGAVLAALVAGPKATAPYSVFGEAVVADILQAENTKIAARAQSVLAEAKSELAKSGAKGHVDLCSDNFQDTVARAKGYTMCHDLTVMGRPDRILGNSEVLFEEVLFTAGRPVLLPGSDDKPPERVQKILLAWDGSSHSSRALAAALAVFDGIKEIDVVVVRGEKNLSAMVPAANVAAHIERHGVRASTSELKVDEKGVSSIIDTHAVKSGADLVVMGAFGHSRLREFILGGVTRDLTKSSSRPLLLAH